MCGRLVTVLLVVVLCAGVGYTYPDCGGIGVGVGVFFPTSAKVRDRFGDSWYGFGLSFGGSGCPSCPTLGTDFAFVSRDSGNNYVYLLPVGVSYIYPLPATANVVPYVGVGADLVFSDILSIPDNVHAGIRMGTELGLITGIAFFQNWQLQARYNFLSPIAGFDFSGLSLSTSVTFSVGWSIVDDRWSMIDCRWLPYGNGKIDGKYARYELSLKNPRHPSHPFPAAASYAARLTRVRKGRMAVWNQQHSLEPTALFGRVRKPRSIPLPLLLSSAMQTSPKSQGITGKNGSRTYFHQL